MAVTCAACTSTASLLPSVSLVTGKGHNMGIIVIYPQCSKESAEELAKKMGWDSCNPFREVKRDFREYDGVFNYGCNREIYARNVINKTKSVATCINKVATFEAFKKADIPTVAYTTKHEDVPRAWDIVVIRDKIDGNKAEGLDYYYHEYLGRDQEINDVYPMKRGALYTEHFAHNYELRVVVFCGNVVGCYKKVNNNGQWDFVPQDFWYALERHAIDAAKALDIDYVGFDVLVNDKGAYVFLEANSGPILTDEVSDAIAGYVK